MLFKSRRGRHEREERGTDERRFSDGNGRKIEALENRLVFRVLFRDSSIFYFPSLSYYILLYKEEEEEEEKEEQEEGGCFLITYRCRIRSSIFDFPSFFGKKRRVNHSRTYVYSTRERLAR